MAVRIAVVGAGYWGINHVRYFAGEPRCELTWVCEPSEQNQARARRIAPHARYAASLAQALEAGDVDAVVIATPAVTHAEIAVQALAAGRHVLVEKPLALSVTDARRVAQAAAAAQRVAMVGHLMLFHPAVEFLKRLVQSGELGEVHYLTSVRVNLGKLRHDENALWSFAPHDLSMIDYLLGGQPPESVAAWGQAYLQPGVEDVVFANLRYPGGQMASIQLSWLSPRKERRLTLVGSKKMAEFDDTAAEKLRIHDRGYERPPEFTQFSEYLTIRDGDIYIPHLRMTEPLAAECRHFLDCIESGATPRTDLASAVRAVEVLSALQQSLESGGAPIAIG